MRITPETLVDIELIKQVKYRYLRAVDTRDWELLATTLTEDVHATYGERISVNSREELVNTLRESMPENMISEHHAHHPEIEIHGDHAEGKWTLHDQVLIADLGFFLAGSAFYEDSYRKVNGDWLISATGYVRNLEYVMDTRQIESFTVTDNFFAHK